MTYQPNPDAPIGSEQHPEKWDRFCNARGFIEEALGSFVRIQKRFSGSKPTEKKLKELQEMLHEHVMDEFNIGEEWCKAYFGTGIWLNERELKTIIKENWNGTN